MSAAETPGSLVTAALVRVGRPPVIPLPAGPGATSTVADRLHGRRVVVIGLDYFPAATPIAPYTTGVAEHLASLGAEVTVLAGVPERPDGRPLTPYRVAFGCTDPGWLTPEAPRVTRLRLAPERPRGRDRRTPARLAREVGFLTAVWLATRSLQADLVVAVTPSPGGAAAAARLAARRDVPLVTLVQGTVPRPGPHRSCRPRRDGGAAGWITAALERYALRGSDQVAVASEAFLPATEAARVSPERLHFMPNWTQVPPAAESRLTARAALGWASERFTVVHAGPMSPRQDLLTVVEAARRLGDAADVVLVGDGIGRAALEQHAFGLTNVRFLDPVDDEVLPLVLAAADALVVSGTGSGEPGQLAAYLSAGRPVLAAVPDAGPVACELRRAGEAGIRVGPGDPDALARAVVALQSSPQQRAAMGRSALRYARAHLSRAASMRRLELILDAALGGPGDEARTRGC